MPLQRGSWRARVGGRVRRSDRLRLPSRGLLSTLGEPDEHQASPDPHGACDVRAVGRLWIDPNHAHARDLYRYGPYLVGRAGEDVPAARMVYFGFNKSAVPSEGDEVLQESAKHIAECAPTRITLVGHTDTLEPEPDVMSKSRTDAVARRLEALGVTVEIQIRSAGATELY